MNNSGISRRTLAKGAAWTAPAVAIAAAAPAMAASPDTCKYTIEISKTQSCKKANLSAYHLVFDVVASGVDADGNPCVVPSDCTATIKYVRTNGKSDNGDVIWSNDLGVEGSIGIDICDAPNMGNFLAVGAVISCNGDTKVTEYIVAMPSDSSLTGSYCSTAAFCANGTTTPTQTATATPTQTATGTPTQTATTTPAPTPSETATPAPTATAPVTPAPTQPSATTPAPSGTGSPTTKPGKP